jgi:hypothetical protein
VGGQRHASAVLTPRKTQYSLYRRLGGPQGRSGQVWKILNPAHSESLYRMSYPCLQIIQWIVSIYYYFHYFTNIVIIIVMVVIIIIIINTFFQSLRENIHHMHWQSAVYW